MQHNAISTMPPLEQLRPFVSLCQACGLIPYTIKYDSTNEKLLGFSFSFGNLITWWFLLVAILQLTAPCALLMVTGKLVKVR